MIVSILAISPNSSTPFSITSGSDTLGSNITALGVTSKVPFTTSVYKNKTQRFLGNNPATVSDKIVSRCNLTKLLNGAYYELHVCQIYVVLSNSFFFY